MKVQSFDLIQVADYPESPEWMHRVFDVLNNHIDVLTTSLQNRQSFGDNSNAEVVTIDLENDTETKIRLQTLTGRPRHAVLLRSSILDYGRLAWELTEEDLVNVKVKWDTSPTTATQAVLVFFGD